jgi:lantibiotic modifying enzyme
MSAELVGIASAVGDDIAARAVWSGDRCSFTGAMPEEGIGGSIVLTYRAVGADLYGGTAGIGLFLAELAAVTGSATHHEVARGALRHAASRADHVPDVCRAGLYAGRPGIALALARAAGLLEAPELLDAARAVADPGPPEAGAEYDLISGSAGAVLGCLALRALLGEDRLLVPARAHADALVDSAVADGDGMMWRSSGVPTARGLAGLSHGAAGVAVALLELARATDEPRYRDVAVRAIAYERSVYDAGMRNWPDLREQPGHAPSATPTFVAFWCHGAPGIALSRIRAMELGVDGAREEALAALATTAAWVEAGVGVDELNYSYCHGLAGNSEVLVDGRALVGPAADELATRVAQTGIERYAGRGLPWPSGAHGGQTPSLFLGTAGVGRFYLRLAQPELPSLLLPRPEALGTPVRRLAA